MDVVKRKHLIGLPGSGSAGQLGIAGNGDVLLLSDLAEVIDGNGAALIVPAVEGTAGDVQIQGVAIGGIFGGVGTAEDVQRIGEPCVSGVAIVLRGRVDVLGDGVNGTAGDIDLSHTEGNTAVQCTVGDGQIYLTGHVDGRPLLCGEGTAVNLKVHITGGVVAGQCSILGRDGAAVYHCGAVILRINTVVIGGNDSAAFQREFCTAAVDTNGCIRAGDGSVFAGIRYGEQPQNLNAAVAGNGHCVAAQIQRDVLPFGDGDILGDIGQQSDGIASCGGINSS